MAEGSTVSSAVFWSRDLSDEEQPIAFIPGVSSGGNLRPGSKFNSQRTEEVKLRVPRTTTSVPIDPPSNRGEGEQQAIYEGEGMRSASLKDLCLEDKKRIANLIKELARVSEEKEVTEERLKAEQESFEKKIRQMEEQNDLIIKEREALQQQYRECQELLSLYQKYLTEQQEKLNLSISELGVLNSKQQGSDRKSPPQPVPLEFDGSYLGLAGTQTLYKTGKYANPGSAGLFSVSQHLCQNDAKTRMTFQSTLQEDLDENPLENGFQKRFNNTPLTFKHLEQHLPNVTDSMDLPYQNAMPHQTVAPCCMRSPPRNAEHVQSRCTSEHLPKRHPGTISDSRGSHGNPEMSVLNEGAEPRPREMVHGKRLPSEKKQVLLLQKMELEIEKERLQQMLAQQEARLLLKQQQLQQSRLDYDRFRDENEIHAVHNEAFMKGQHPVVNGKCSAQSPLKHVCEEYLSKKTPASSKAQNRSRGDSSGKKTVGFSAYSEAAELRMHPTDVSRSKKGFRRDAATSPVMVRSTKDLVTTATSPIRRNMSRYDASLLNLVEAMSPISVQRPPLLYPEPFDWTSKNLTPWSQHKPGRCPVASARRGRVPEEEEQEESRILEEIFFI